MIIMETPLAGAHIDGGARSASVAGGRIANRPPHGCARTRKQAAAPAAGIVLPTGDRDRFDCRGEASGASAVSPRVPSLKDPQHVGSTAGPLQADSAPGVVGTTPSSVDHRELHGRFLDLATGELIDRDQLLLRLADARVVYVSESHDNPAHHELQLALLKALAADNPKITVAMEFLYRQDQALIDAYARGELPETEFAAAVRDGFGAHYPFYRDLLRYARARGLKLLGMNVATATKRKMLAEGWEHLTAEEQRLIARDIDLSDPAYRAYLLKALAPMLERLGPQPSSEKVERLLKLQALWDETFAEAIANHLKAEDDPARQVLVVVGCGHVRHRFTVPLKAHARYPAPFKTLVPVEANANHPVDLKAIMSSNVADFVYFSDRTKPARPKTPCWHPAGLSDSRRR